MSWLKKLFGRVRAQVQQERFDRDLDEELRFHLDMEAAEKLRGGMSAEQARQSALRQFGGLQQIKEGYREARGLPWIDTLWQDLSYSWRMLARNPAFAAVAVLTLSLGIGATTAIFSVVYAVLLRPLPYPEPERLVWVTEVVQKFPGQPEHALAPDFIDWRRQNNVFSSIAMYSTQGGNFSDGENPERVATARVTADFLRTLGVAPLLGRDFSNEEDQPGRYQVAILSYGFWQRQFGGRKDVLGAKVKLDSETFDVIGVLPADFEFPGGDAVELLWPKALDVEQQLRRQMMIFSYVIARLKPGVSIGRAIAALEVIEAGIIEQAPQMKEWDLRIKIVPLHEQLTGNVRLALLVLFGAVGFVLGIACLNVANLLLARSSARQREMAVRASLGAGRRRLLRQLLTESLLLAGIAGVLGLAMGFALRTSLTAIAPERVQGIANSHFDGAVVGFALACSVFTVVIFGVAPGWAASRPNLNAALKAGMRGASETRASGRLLGLLVAGELALALVLMTGAGLLIHSFWHMRYHQLGFQPDQVLSASILLNRSNQPGSGREQAFFDEVLQRAAALPGVEAAAVSSGLPPVGAGFCVILQMEGTPLPSDPMALKCVPHQVISPAYFQTLGIPLVEGESFTGTESENSAPVAVVNATFAARYFPNEDPVGKRFRGGRGNGPWRTILGVAGDVRNQGLNQPIEPDGVPASAAGWSRRRQLAGDSKLPAARAYRRCAARSGTRYRSPATGR